MDALILSKVGGYPFDQWTYDEVESVGDWGYDKWVTRTFRTTTPYGVEVRVWQVHNHDPEKYGSQGLSIDGATPDGMGRGLAGQLFEELSRKASLAHLDRLERDPAYREEHERAEREAEEKRRRDAMGPLDKL